MHHNFSKLIKFSYPASPPCLNAIMTAAALNIKLNMKAVDMEKQEHLAPEFVKLNPEHCVPTLVDKDFVLWESRSICLYLAEKFDHDGVIFPKEPEVRGKIYQRLFFDLGTLYKQLADYYFCEWYGTVKTPELLKRIDGTVKLLDSFLEPTGFVAGTKKMTVADIVSFSTISSFEASGFDPSPYPNVKKWLALMKETVPGRKFSEESLAIIRGYFTK